MRKNNDTRKSSMKKSDFKSLLLTTIAIGVAAESDPACPAGYEASTSWWRKSYPGYGSVNGVGGLNTLTPTAKDCANLCSADNVCGSFEWSDTSKVCELNLSRYAISWVQMPKDSQFCAKTYVTDTLDPPVFNPDGSLSGLRWFSSIWAPAETHPSYQAWKEANMHGSIHTPFGWWSSASEEHKDGPHWMAVDVRMKDALGTLQPRLVCGAIVAGRNAGPGEHEVYWPTIVSFRYSLDKEKWYTIGHYWGNTEDNYKDGKEIKFSNCVETNYVRFDPRQMNTEEARPGGRMSLIVAQPDIAHRTPFKLEKEEQTCEDDAAYTMNMEECRDALAVLNSKLSTSGFYSQVENDFEISSTELPTGCIIKNPGTHDMANYPFAKQVKFNTANYSGIKCNTYSDVDCLCLKKKLTPILNQNEGHHLLPDGTTNNRGFCYHQGKMTVIKDNAKTLIECQEECVKDPLCGYMTFNSNTDIKAVEEIMWYWPLSPEPKCMLYHQENCVMSKVEDGLRVLKKHGWHYYPNSYLYYPHGTMRTWRNEKQQLPFTHEGCYPSVDYPTSRWWQYRAIRYRHCGYGGTQYKHRSFCAKLCEGFEYFGMKYREDRKTSYCYCGMEIQNNQQGELPSPVDATNCDHKCEGDQSHTCGGVNHMDVYKVTAVTHAIAATRALAGVSGAAARSTLALPDWVNQNSAMEEDQDAEDMHEDASQDDDETDADMQNKGDERRRLLNVAQFGAPKSAKPVNKNAAVEDDENDADPAAPHDDDEDDADMESKGDEKAASTRLVRKSLRGSQ